MSLFDDFQRDGAVVVRGLLTADEIALLAQGMAANRAAPGPLAKVASAADDPGEFFEDFCNWTRNAAYERVLRESKLAEAAAQLTGSATVRLYHDHLLIKTAGTKTPTPWHQDQPYYNIEGRQTVSFWIPIDPVPREATLEFVAGSHLGPWLMPVSFRDREAKWFPPGALAPLPDIEADRGAWPIIGWALEPGDAVAFNMATLHAASGSTTDRRVFSARFIGDDVRHAPRPWTTSPEFEGLDIPAGGPMDHPLFPVVWR